MDLLSEMRSAVQSDLTVGDESSLLPPSTIDLAINRAYTKIGGMFRWPDTKDALKTSTIAGNEYYLYPQNWRPDSIWKLTVDGQDYGDPLSFKDYLFEKENNFPSGLQFAWANEKKKYFLSPIPTSNGVNNVYIWGFKFVDKLVLNGDITIFSYSMPEVNEAIILEATAILKNKGDMQAPVLRSMISGTLLISLEAKGIVTDAWAKISNEQAKLKRTTQQWNMPDLFASRLSNRQSVQNTIGNF